MARAKATITGDDAVVRVFKQLRARAKDVEPAWREVGDYIADEMVKQFDTQGAYFGKPWKPLKPEYLAWKVAHRFDPRTLHRTGKMRKSFTSKPMSVQKMGAKRATFGSDDPKVVWHQKGTRRGLPARPMLFATPKMRRDVNRILDRYIRDGRVV